MACAEDARAQLICLALLLSRHLDTRLLHAQTDAANLLFLDHPVGTGWSYVEKHGEFGEGR